jgi:beta-N-acetylhexosaminidase
VAPLIGAFISGCAGLALTQDEVAFFRATNPWGLILFARNVAEPAQISALTRSFRDIVGRADAPVFIDQEGGRVQRLGPPNWRAYPPGNRLGALYARDPVHALRAARLVARLMASDLAELGINADCVPVLDVPQEGADAIIGDRAYSNDPKIVGLLGRAVMQGMLEGGVLPVIKHIPGHGRAGVDSHLSLPVVDAPLAELEAIDFLPFAALADAPMAMTAHVVYSAIDPQHPATLSSKVIRLIREQIGFDGLLMSDDVSMKALSGSLEDISRNAIAAGCDIALHCNGKLEEMQAVAHGAGVLQGASLERARNALARQRKPSNFDENQALVELSGLISASV